MSPHPTRKQLAFSLAGLALAPVVTLYATQVVWLESLWAPLPWMATHGKAVGLFWLLFSSLSFTLYGLFRRLFPACLPEVAVFMGVAVTSRYKMNINGTPLQLSDFAFVENLGEVTGYATAQLIPSLTMILGIAIAAVLTETLRRKETWRPSRRAGLLVSAAGVALLLAALLPGAPLQKAALALDQDSADQSARNQQAGVVLGIYTAWAQRVEVIQAEGNAQAAQLADTFRKGALSPGAAASEGTPDIIFITSESFFDVTRLPGITFEEDPLPNFPPPGGDQHQRLVPVQQLRQRHWKRGDGDVHRPVQLPPPGGGYPHHPGRGGLCPAAHHRPAAEAGGVCHGVRPRPHQRAVQPRHHPPRHWV